MTNLTRAHQELFRRKPDEMYGSIPDLFRQCQMQKENSTQKWVAPAELKPVLKDYAPNLKLGDEGEHHLNNWSFLQLCNIAGVSKDTVNKVSPKTAVDILLDTLPGGTKPLQFLVEKDRIRSIQGSAYARLYNADLLGLVSEFATDFQPAQEASGGGTGLYAGEQDMFCFLIDPTGWTEINGEAFAPGFFLWNSEVGRRTVGIQTFWFQKICQNHIVWDATEVIEFKRRHTGDIHESMNQIRKLVENLSKKRDERKDGFYKVMEKAMNHKFGKDAEETLKQLRKHGIPQGLAKEAVKTAKENGAFTVFAVVDALTRLSRRIPNAGDRNEVDQKASKLLSLVA